MLNTNKTGDLDMKKFSNYILCTSAAFVAMWATPSQADGPGIDIKNINGDDPFYYTSDVNITADDGQSESVGVGRPMMTHSRVPHLPVYHGYMSTNSTYRFVNVAEQVFTMIGEGKHGLWRVGENGLIREYLKAGAEGLPPDADLNDPANLDIIKNNYSSFIEEESWDGYKYPDQVLSDAGTLNYIDLSIHHASYEGKYDDHPAIDLASYNCTMSGPAYPYSKEIMDFAFSQPLEGQVGPLGKRAGIDIEENYTKVLRLDHMVDGRTWVNVGVPGKDETHVNYKAVDPDKTAAEYYLVERPFFNVPYLFIVAVYDDAEHKEFEYVRPDGAYWDTLSDADKGVVKTEVDFTHTFHLEEGGTAVAQRLPVYGLHHPNRNAFGSGGACPSKGGDWGRYPQDNSGAMWPTNYEEVTPYCDAVVVDIKFSANLDGEAWNQSTKYLANAGVGSDTITHKMRPGVYGTFEDAYLVEKGLKNPFAFKAPETVTITYPEVRPAVTYTE